MLPNSGDKTADLSSSTSFVGCLIRRNETILTISTGPFSTVWRKQRNSRKRLHFLIIFVSLVLLHWRLISSWTNRFFTREKGQNWRKREIHAVYFIEVAWKTIRLERSNMERNNNTSKVIDYTVAAAPVPIIASQGVDRFVDDVDLRELSIEHGALYQVRAFNWICFLQFLNGRRKKKKHIEWKGVGRPWWDASLFSTTSPCTAVRTN